MPRTGNPNWHKGMVAPNPGGRPKDVLGQLLRSKGKLPQEIYDSIHPLLKSKSEKVRIMAAEFLRDTAWGKPISGVIDQDGNWVPYSLTIQIDPGLIKQNGKNGKEPDHQPVA